ncbi:hypothetical protein AgCh_023586 [Apium graveolens]
MKPETQLPLNHSKQQDKILSPTQHSVKTTITNGSAKLLLPKKNREYDMRYPKTPTRPTKRQRLKRNNITFSNWCHLPPDLLKLVANKLNYEQRVSLRATCKNWPNESMFTYFMTMAQRLGNMDAEFYWITSGPMLPKLTETFAGKQIRSSRQIEHISTEKDHGKYSMFIDQEEVRKLKVNVVEWLMKIPKKARDDMRRYIVYELLPGLVYGDSSSDFEQF